MKILVFGGTGFIGSALIPFLQLKGCHVLTFSRKPSVDQYYWDPTKGLLDKSFLENCDGVINLSGENIFGRGSQEKLERITKSRLETADLLINTLLSLSFPPHFYIGASAIGYYGDRGNELLNEESGRGDDFFAYLCEKLENIENRLNERNIRTIHARFGIVLGKKGGILKKMTKAFTWGLGAQLGRGKQMMSWIDLEDLLRAIFFVINENTLSGAINFTSPLAVTNAQFTKTLAKELSRPTLLRIPEGIIKFYFGALAPLFLNSIRAYPQKLLDKKFEFQYVNLNSSLKHYL